MAKGTGQPLPVNTYEDRDMLKAVIQERQMEKAAAGGGGSGDNDFERWQYQQPSYARYGGAPAVSTVPVQPSFGTPQMNSALVQSYQAYIDQLNANIAAMPGYLQDKAYYPNMPTLEEYADYFGGTDPAQIKRYEYGIDEITPTPEQSAYWKTTLDYYKIISDEAAKLGITPLAYEQMMRDTQRHVATQNPSYTRQVENYQAMGNLKYGAPPAAYKQLEYPQNQQIASSEVQPQDLIESTMWVQKFTGWSPDQFSPLHPANIAAEYGRIVSSPVTQQNANERLVQLTALRVAYEYLQNLPLNQGKPVKEWVWSSQVDEQMLNLLQVMPQLMVMEVDGETKLAWQQYSYPFTATQEQQAAILPYGYSYSQGGLLYPSRVQEIPGAYKGIYNFMSSPTAQGTAMGALMGLVSGLGQGIPGLIYGTATGALGGGGTGFMMGKLGELANPTNPVNQMLVSKLGPFGKFIGQLPEVYLNLQINPSIWAEQAGTTAFLYMNFYGQKIGDRLIVALADYVQGDQLAFDKAKVDVQAAYDEFFNVKNFFEQPIPEQLDIMKERFGRTWQAGVFGYESFAPEIQLVNIPIAVSNALSWLANEPVAPYVPKGYALPYGAPEPVKVKIPGIDPNVPYQAELALNYFANKYAVGTTSLQQMDAEAQKLFGVGGNFNDTIFSTLFDPLWLAPGMQRFAVGKLIANWTRNADLIKATTLAEAYGGGMFTIGRNYINIKSAITDKATLSPFELNLTQYEKTQAGYDIKAYSASNRVALFGMTLMEAPISPLNWVNAIKELTPASKAHLYAQIAMEHFGELMSYVRSDIHPDVYKAMMDAAMQMAYGADTGSVVRLGALLDSVEMSVVKQGAVDAYSNLKKFYDVWVKGRPNIDILTKLADSLSVSNVDLVRRWNGYDGTNKAKYQQLSNEFNLGKTEFTEKAVTSMFDWIGKNAWSPEGFQAKITQLFLDSMGNFAVDHYGVGKNAKWQKGFWNYMGAMKAAQSLVLLNLSWNYARRNILNNTVMARIYGVFGVSSKQVRENFWNDFGFEPYGSATLPQDLMGSEFGKKGGEAVSKMAQKITEAERIAAQEGVKGVAENLVYGQYAKDTMGVVSKYANITGHVSSLGENKARAEANYAGVKKAMSYLWRPEIDPTISKMMNSLGVDSGFIQNQLLAARNSDEIKQILDGAKLGPRWESVIDPAAKALGIDTSQAMDVIRHWGMDEYLRNELPKVLEGKRSIESVRRDLFRRMEDKLSKMTEADLLGTAASAEAITTAEGAISAHNVMVELEHLRQEVMQLSQNEWDNAAKANIDAAYAEAEISVNKLWENFKKRREATITGLLKSWGFTDGSIEPILSKSAVDLSGLYMTYMRTFDRFFAERSRMWAEARELPAKERAGRFMDIKRDLFDLYQQYAGDEVRNIQALAEQFDRMWDGQYKGVTPAPLRDYFSKLIANARARHDAVLDMRRFELGELDQKAYKNQDVWKLVYGQNPAESDKLWPRFWQEIYNPIVLDGMQKIQKAQGDLNVAVETRKPAEAGAEAPVAMDTRTRLIEQARQDILRLIPGSDELVDNLINTMFNEPPARPITTQDIDLILQAYPEFIDPAIRTEAASRFYDILYVNKEVARLNLLLIQDASRTIADFEAATGTKAEAPAAEAPTKHPKHATFVDALLDAGVAEKPAQAAAILNALHLPPNASIDDVLRIGRKYRELRDGGMEVKDAAKLAMMELNRSPMLAGPMLGGKLADNGATIAQHADINGEPYYKVIKPLLNEMFKQFNTTNDLDLGSGLKNATPEQKTVLNQFRTKLLQDYAQTKLTAMRAGVTQADMALLNYNMRTNMNAYTGIFYPFIFWTMRSARNWAHTVIERPALMSAYIRLLNLMSSYSEEDTQFPSRHRGKLRIPMFGLPDWADNAIYYDPMGDLVPLNQFIKPFEMVNSLSTRLEEDAFNYLREDFKNGRITSKQFLDAVGEDPEKRGVAGNPLWEAALNKAKAENSGGPMDFMQLFASPNLFFSAAYNKYQNMKNGTSNPVIDQLPVSKTWQGMWGMFGMDPSEMGGWLGKQQKSISEITEWGLYYVKRALSNMAGMNPDITREAITAMIEQRGPLWEEAEKQVRFEQGLQQGLAPVYALTHFDEVGWKGLAGAALLSLFPGGLVPEGELKQRYIHEEYQAAWQRYNDGTDPGALDKFFDAYPEVDARTLLFEDDPNALFNRFQAIQMQNIYWADTTTDLMRRQMREQLGEEWYIGVINSSTRDPTAFAPEKMAEWSHQLGMYVPELAGGALEYNKLPALDMPKLSMSQLYDQMKDEQLAVAPNLYALNDLYYSLPIAGQEQYKLSNPAYQQAAEARIAAIEKYVISVIPKFHELEDGYYAIGSGILEKLKDQYPELRAAWDYEKLLKEKLLAPFGDWQTLMNEYWNSGESKSDERKAFAKAHPDVYEINKIMYEKIPEIIAERYPMFDYLDKLYNELGGKARGEYLEKHPDLLKGWDIIDEHKEDWLKIDPLYDEHNEEYWDLPPSPRTLMLREYPELKRAWGIEDVYVEQNPGLNKWINDTEQQEQYKATQEVMEQIPPEAYSSVLKYFVLDEPLDPVYRMALEWEWEKRGKPFADFWKWLESMRYMFEY